MVNKSTNINKTNNHLSPLQYRYPLICSMFDFQGHLSWSPFFVYSELWWEVIVRFVDIGGLVCVLNCLWIYIFICDGKTDDSWRQHFKYKMVIPVLIDIFSTATFLYNYHLSLINCIAPHCLNILFLIIDNLRCASATKITTC
jgi:hypothetical protein